MHPSRTFLLLTLTALSLTACEQEQELQKSSEDRGGQAGVAGSSSSGQSGESGHPADAGHGGSSPDGSAGSGGAQAGGGGAGQAGNAAAGQGNGGDSGQGGTASNGGAGGSGQAGSGSAGSSAGSGGSAGATNSAVCSGGEGLAATPWPTVGGCSSRQGRSSQKSSGFGKQRWKVDQLSGQILGGFSAPSLGPDSTLLVGGTGIGNPGGFFAVTPAGEKKWGFLVDKDVQFAHSTAAVSKDGTIYVGSENFGQIGAPWESAMYALSSQGKLLWSFDTQGATPSNPAIGKDGTLYFGGFAHAYAVSSAGKLVWDVPTEHSTGTPSIGKDGTVYFPDYGGYLHAISPEGKLKWSFQAATDVTGVPVVADSGVIYIVAGYSHLYAIHPDGSQQWDYKVSPDTPLNVGGGLGRMPALGHDGTIYIGHNKALHAISPEGNELWSRPSIPALSAPIITLDDHVLVTTTDGRVCEVTSSGEEVSCVQVLSGKIGTLYGSPVLGADGTLYVGGWAEGLFAYGP